ncbi:hypothetical protein PAPHI01_0796 [Pancytospora philotis]|nr:hypothetical protein PAPHI01_0796 [Pancytospora philotis]
MLGSLLLAFRAACTSVSNPPATPPSNSLSLASIEDTCDGYHKSIMTNACEFATIIEVLSPKVEGECREMSKIFKQLEVLYEPTECGPYWGRIAELRDKYLPMDKRFKPVQQTLCDNLIKVYAIVLAAHSYMDSVKPLFHEKGCAGAYQPVELADVRAFEAKKPDERAVVLNNLIATYVLNFNSLLACLMASSDDTALKTFEERHGSRLRLYKMLMRSGLDDNTYLAHCAKCICSIYSMVFYFHDETRSSEDMDRNEMINLAQCIRKSLVELKTGFNSAYRAFKVNYHTSFKNILTRANPRHALPSSSTAGSSLPERSGADESTQQV